MIPETTREALLDAMATFDREQRDTPAWMDWEGHRNHKYAIRHDGRLYPVKEIISLATNVPTERFWGGNQSNAYVQKYGFEVTPIEYASEPRVWWVNQSDWYDVERAGRYIWSSRATDRGTVPVHWEMVTQVRKCDILVHYHNQNVRARGRATSDGYEGPRPAGDGSEASAEIGRIVNVEYVELPELIPVQRVLGALQALDITNGPVERRRARVKQGYVWRFSVEGLRVLRRASSQPWPDWAESLCVGNVISPVTTTYADISEAVARTGLHVSDELLSNYLLALQCKRFVIFTGISGTGKTQLALAVAKNFRPVVKVRETPRHADGRVVVNVSPYMFDYNRMNMPVTLLTTLSLFGNGLPQQSSEIEVVYPEGHTKLRLWKDLNRSAYQLLFREEFRAWFEEHFEVGDQFLVGVELATNREEARLRFSLPSAAVREEPLDNYCVVAVRPDWTDNRGLLGYYNPLTNQYSTTPVLELLLRAQEDCERAKQEGNRDPYPFFVILDEMNLARVEHYFSDFLSSLESGEPIVLHNDLLLEAIDAGSGSAIPRQLTIPENVFITGTVNVDETTYMFSPKVLDRAFTIEINEVDLRGYGVNGSLASAHESPLRVSRYCGTLRQAARPNGEHWMSFGSLLDGELCNVVIALNEMLEGHSRHFGYRVANEIARFVVLASLQAGEQPATLWAALDVALLQKVLPKFHGTQQELEGPLNALFAFAIKGLQASIESVPKSEATNWKLRRGYLIWDGITPTGSPVQPKLPRVAGKVWRMLQRLRLQGYTSFIE